MTFECIEGPSEAAGVPRRARTVVTEKVRAIAALRFCVLVTLIVVVAAGCSDRDRQQPLPDPTVASASPQVATSTPTSVPPALSLRLPSTRMSGHSMEPSILDGSVIRFDPNGFHDADPKRGDVVIHTGEYPMIVRRIIGLPSETLRALVTAEPLTYSALTAEA